MFGLYSVSKYAEVNWLEKRTQVLAQSGRAADEESPHAGMEF
jgi:hypothetical protein